MRIALVTPYLPESRNGNAHTASRYARFLRRAGHRVEMSLYWDGQPADALLALHARRVHDAIARYAAAHPERPLVLVLTGTDLYRDIREDADAQRSLALASRVVVLQARGPEELPAAIQAKTRVIEQSAPPRLSGRRPKNHFAVAVVSHLRDEKNPFLPEDASRLLPASSRIRIRHVGSELQDGLADVARRKQNGNPRWHWLGGLGHGRARGVIADSHLLLLPSRMEGGANVIVEAVMSGTPVLASDIPGNRGMLGENYAGYFPLDDAAALAALLRRAENEPAFYRRLAEQCATRRPLFEPAREMALVAGLFA